jgi:hypothetical protein
MCTYSLEIIIIIDYYSICVYGIIYGTCNVSHYAIDIPIVNLSIHPEQPFIGSSLTVDCSINGSQGDVILIFGGEILTSFPYTIDITEEDYQHGDTVIAQCISSTSYSCGFVISNITIYSQYLFPS